MNVSRIVGLIVAAVVALPAAAVAAPTITEYSSGLPAGSGPSAVVSGADGNVWFVDAPVNPNAVGRISPAGTVAEFASGLSADAQLTDIGRGPGGVWVTERKKNRIARIAANGAVTEFAVSGAARKPMGIVAGPDGNLWFTALDGHGAIGKMSPTGAVTTYTAGLTPDAGLADIALGPDGNLWFTESAARKVGRITPQGVITEFSAGLARGTPQAIAAGPDGNLWFTESGLLPGVARISPQGTITEFSVGLPLSSAPASIAAGADGNVYFTDSGANGIGQVTPAGVITMTTAGIRGAADLAGITTGADGALWFAEQAGAMGRMTVAPGVGTVALANVTDAVADASGTVQPNSQATTYHFEWGTTTAYGSSSTPTAAGAGSSTQSVAATLTGLAPSTTYHVRLVASNATGTTASVDRTFTTTAAGAPSATTEPASSVAVDTATLNADINPENAATTYRFDWGTTTGYGSQIPLSPAPVGSDAATHAVSQQLTGLAPNTTYHYRVVASSASGTTSGDDQSLRTVAVPPNATTDPASDVTATTATLGGTINPLNSATAYRIEYGPSTAYGSVTPDADLYVANDATDHAVSRPISGLEPNRTYHFRVIATNNAGETDGGDQVVTTTALAPS